MQWPLLSVHRPDEKLDFSSIEREFATELAEVLVQHDIKVTTPQIQERFRVYRRYEEIFDDPGIEWCDRVRLTRVAWKLVKLWNYTPRQQLGERRPAELLLEQSSSPPCAQVPDEELCFVRLPGMFKTDSAGAGEAGDEGVGDEG